MPLSFRPLQAVFPLSRREERGKTAPYQRAKGATRRLRPWDASECPTGMRLPKALEPKVVARAATTCHSVSLTLLSQFAPDALKKRRALFFQSFFLRKL